MVSLDEIAAALSAPKQWLLKVVKPQATAGQADAIPSEGDTWPTPVAFTPLGGPPGSIMDAGGKIRYGMDSSGYVPTTDERGAAIESALDKIRYMIYGFYGPDGWKDPGLIKTAVVYAIADAGGTLAATALIAAVAAKKIRVLGIAFKVGGNNASGSLTVDHATTVGGVATCATTDITADIWTPWAPLNSLATAVNEAVNISGSNLGANQTVNVMIAWRTEDT